jgi:aromatic-L-amino-acid decarboxylase
MTHERTDNGSRPRRRGDDPEEFRREGHNAIDWAVDFLETAEQRPVLPPIAPGVVRSRLPSTAPEDPESLKRILADFKSSIVPGLTQWNHPGFMGFFNTSSPGPAILGELLAATVSVNGMLWKTSPALTELEEVVTDWLRQGLALPPTFRGTLTESASMGAVAALAAAREEVPGVDVRKDGIAGPHAPRLRMYTSAEAHSSLIKAAIVLGIGERNVVQIPVDSAFRMDVRALSQSIRRDRSAGLVPFAVAATAGTTSTNSIDPLPGIATVCRREALWFHVDAAQAGMAGLVPELRPLLAGLELADSIVTNPHKWLFTPLECSAFFVRRPEALTRVFRVVPAYLRTDEVGATNYQEWGPHLSRRFRALKLWMVMRAFGLRGLRERLREHVRLGQLFASWVDATPGFERLAPTPLNTVCFRARPAGYVDGADLDALNAGILEEVNASGEIFLSPTRVIGRLSLRITIGHVRTEERHVARAWQLVQEGLRNALPPPSVVA